MFHLVLPSCGMKIFLDEALRSILCRSDNKSMSKNGRVHLLVWRKNQKKREQNSKCSIPSPRSRNDSLFVSLMIPGDHLLILFLDYFRGPYCYIKASWHMHRFGLIDHHISVTEEFVRSVKVTTIMIGLYFEQFTKH